MQEKNRNTLLRALSQLPEYNPPGKVWDALHEELDQKESELPLQEAIRDLPDYEPPAFVWENISGEIEVGESAKTLRKAIDELPEYNPPDLVWKGVQKELESDQERRAPGVGRVVPLWRRPAVAAGFTALLCALAWMVVGPGANEESITYSSVEVNMNFDDKENVRDEEAFQLVLAEFNQQPHLNKDPYLVELQRELENLNLAKRQLEEVMGAYGDDEELVLQVTNIEHERSAVLKEMVTKI